MKLTPDNIAGPLAYVYGEDWRDAITFDPGEDPDNFETQLKLIDAVQCDLCDGWFEDGDTASDPDGYSEHTCCTGCWEAVAEDAFTRREYEAAHAAIRVIEDRQS